MRCSAPLASPTSASFFRTPIRPYKNIDSQLLLRRVVAELHSRGYAPSNIDATLIAEKPKIYPRLGEIKAVLASSTELSPDAIGLKATTNEGVDDLGRGLAIAAHAVALIEKI